MPQIPALRSADGEGSQGTGAARATECSTGGHPAGSGGPLGLLPAPKPWDVKTSPQMTSFILATDIGLPLLDQPCAAMATWWRPAEACAALQRHVRPCTVRSGYVSVTLAPPPVSPLLGGRKKRGRKGADVTSPTYDSAEEKAVASQMAVNAPSRSGEKHSGSIARKEACRPPRRAPERGRAACRLRLPCARPCGGAASRAQRRLPAGENNLCEAPGYVRAPPPPAAAPQGSRAAAPDGRGGDTSGRAPGHPSTRWTQPQRHVLPPTVF